MQYRTSSMAVGVFYTFWFEKNLQGDIVAIYNSSGTKLISYTYDAWGNCSATYHNVSGTNTYANLNPFRYRGYYFDSELGFYYLNSRYYDPAVGRFINADVYVSTGQGLLGYNMFAYCNNNPIIFTDHSGKILALIMLGIDIYQCFKLNESTTGTNDAETEPTGVEIQNSYKINSPLVQYGYSFYLNHIKKDTRNVIKGTTAGLTYEWTLHNVAYYGCAIIGYDQYAISAQHVNVGKTLYSDNHKGGASELMSKAMKLSYYLFDPFDAAIDTIVNKGWDWQ